MLLFDSLIEGKKQSVFSFTVWNKINGSLPLVSELDVHERHV